MSGDNLVLVSPSVALRTMISHPPFLRPAPSLGWAQEVRQNLQRLATVTRTSSFGLGREGTLRGPAGGLVALRTAWGGGDVFSS